MRPRAIFLLATCVLPAAPAGAQAPASEPAASQASDFDKTCRDWAVRLEKSVNLGDASLYNESFDAEGMWDRVIEGVYLPDADIKLFYNNLVKRKYGTILCERIRRTKGRYKFLTLRDMLSGRKLALFRQTTGDSQFAYHGLLLRPGKGGRTQGPSAGPADPGKVVIADVFLYAAGDDLSDLIRRLVLLRARQLESSDQPESAKWITTLNTMDDQLDRGRYKEAMDTYGKLPDDAKREKYVQLGRLKALSEVNHQEYLAAYEDFKTRYPDDAATRLLALLYHQVKQQHDKAILAVDDVEQMVGHDPYMSVVRAEIALAADQLDKAKALAAKATQEEPDLRDALELLAYIALKQKDYAELVRLLDLLDLKPGTSIPMLSRSPGYQEFIRSPEYKAWLESKRNKGR